MSTILEDFMNREYRQCSTCMALMHSAYVGLYPQCPMCHTDTPAWQVYNPYESPPVSQSQVLECLHGLLDILEDDQKHIGDILHPWIARAMGAIVPASPEAPVTSTRG